MNRELSFHYGIIPNCRAEDNEGVMQDLASDLLAEATELARQAILPDEQRLNKCRQIIQACLERGQQCLNAKEKDAQSLLDHANQLITEDLVGFSTCVLPWPEAIHVLSSLRHNKYPQEG